MKYSFGTALLFLETGKKIRRAKWPECCYIRLVEYGGEVGIEMVTNRKRGSGSWRTRVAWQIQVRDILADDWEILG